MDGRSLARALTGNAAPDVDAERPLLAETMQPRALFGWAPLAAVRSGKWSYIASPAPRLYDLQSDPGEEHNVAAQHADVAGRLAAEAARIKFEESPCPDCAALVAGLGMTWPPQGRAGAAVDPYDRIDVANDALKAHRTFLRRMAEPAMLLHRDVLARDPDNHVALVELGVITGLGKSKQELKPAVDMLLHAQRLYAEDGDIYHQLAHMDEVGVSPDPARQLALLQLAARLDPLNEEALYDAACAEARAGRPEDAFALLERAIAAGWRDYPHMRKDTDLDTLRSDARFAKLVPPAPERPGGKAKGKGGAAAAAPASSNPS
jgi:tetratricopeptide (TPR) repeat protein